MSHLPNLLYVLALLASSLVEVDCQRTIPSPIRSLALPARPVPGIQGYFRVGHSICSPSLGQFLSHAGCDAVKDGMPSSIERYGYAPAARADIGFIKVPALYSNTRCIVRLDVNGTGVEHYLNTLDAVKRIAEEVISDCIQNYDIGGFKVDGLLTLASSIARRGLLNRELPALKDTMIVSVMGGRASRTADLTKIFLNLLIREVQYFGTTLKIDEQQMKSTLQILQTLPQNSNDWVGQLESGKSNPLGPPQTDTPQSKLVNAKVECLDKFGQPQKADFPAVEDELLQKLSANVGPNTPVTATSGSMTARIEANSVISIFNPVVILLGFTAIQQSCPFGGILASKPHWELKRRDPDLAQSEVTNITVNFNDTDSIVLPPNITLTIYQTGSWQPSD